MSEIEEYLESKDLELYPAPNLNVRTTCFFHGEEGKASEGRLYIKVDDEAEVKGLFFCHVCEETGSLNKIKRHFGDPLDGGSVPSARRIPIMNEAAAFYHGALDQQTLKYLTDVRGLSPEIIMRFRLGRANGSLLEHLLSLEFAVEDIRATGLVRSDNKDFFEEGVLTIPYFDQGSCVQIRGRDLNATKNKYKTPTGQKPLLYNTDTLLHADDVIITEGEFDAMVLEDAGFNAIGAPGTRTFKPEFARFFEDINKVYVCFDTDRPDRKGNKAGQEGAEKTATALGGKARIVELPLLGDDDEIDVSDYFVKHGKTADDFRQLLRQASSGILVTVRDAFEAWLDREGNPDLQGFKLGYEKLDSIIAPGLLPGQLAVFLARTGTGKGQPVDTMIPTLGGYRRMGDLLPGDLIFGSDGKPTPVMAVYDRGVLPTYRVHFSDNTHLDVDGDHIWTVEYQSGHTYRDWKRANLTTSTLANEDLKTRRA